MKTVLFFLNIGIVFSAFSTTLFYAQPTETEGNGSRTAPFTTMEAARNAIRMQRKPNLTANSLEVVFFDGNYCRKNLFLFEKHESYVLESPVVWLRNVKSIDCKLILRNAYPISSLPKLARLPTSPCPHIRFADCAKIESGNRNANETVSIRHENPGFANRAQKDFHLEADTLVLQKYPQFKIPPIGKMGLLRQTGRPLDLYNQTN